VVEVGNSQPISDLLKIRDRLLCWKTAINVVILVSYNRNQTRQADSFFVQVARRDFFAPPPNPLSAVNDYPPCVVLYETAKQQNKYPLVETPVPQQSRVWRIATTILYHPEPPPVLIPALPAAFVLDIEQIRRTIERERPA
jgi:hypothetical protein